MVYKLGLFSSFETDEKVNFRDEFDAHYVGVGNYFLVSKKSIGYNNKLYRLCINLVDKMTLTNSMDNIGEYVLNVGLVPHIEYVNTKTLQSILGAKTGAKKGAQLFNRLKNKALLAICINSYDLYICGLVLPLVSPVEFELSFDDIQELEMGQSVLDTRTVQYKLDSVTYLMDYFKIMNRIIIDALDNDIKEYVFDRLI